MLYICAFSVTERSIEWNRSQYTKRTDEAKTIAASDAGVSVQDVAFTNVYHKYENGYDIIRVEFKKGDTDYKYEIDATTGSILYVHIDFE